MYYAYRLPPKLEGSEGGCTTHMFFEARIAPTKPTLAPTSDFRKRLTEHNVGKSIHTNKFKLWDLVTYVALPDRLLAERFEGYLKSGSGRAFVKRHLLHQNALKS
jgi:putative endonuclease